MTTTKLPLGLERFACGAIEYSDYYSDDLHPRIVVPIHLGSLPLPVLAVVDTGAPWCVLDPALLEELGYNVERLQPTRRPLNIRGIAYSGWLYRVPIRLDATLGHWLEIEATVFAPNLLPGDTWAYPNFIGLEGFLSRIRFAVDPAANFFYFGPLDSS